MKECSVCLYNESVPSITFDSDSVCNYCHLHKNLDKKYPNNREGFLHLGRLSLEIKKAGENNKYDVVVGVSGGCDSSYLLKFTKKMMGLRPLAVHFDNTWNTQKATQNIHEVLSSLQVDLETHVVDNLEYDDLYRSFLYAGVPDIEAPTDMALATVLLQTAEKHGIKYVFDGHSFRTEGICPLDWLYFDGKYIETIHNKYGTIPLKTYPNMPFNKMVKWAVKGIKRIRPLYYLDYDKTEAMKSNETLGWKWYGGHHLENQFTHFYHSYFIPKRFGIDQRVLGYSALIRSGQITREEGMAAMKQEIDTRDIVYYVKKRLGFSEEEFDRLINMPKHRWHEFKTYKKLFERTKPFWWMMMKLNRVPESFYIKYCHAIKR